MSSGLELGVLVRLDSDFTSVKCPRLGVKHAETIYLTEDTGVGSKVFLRCEKNFQLNPAGPIFECLTGGIWNATVEPVCLEESKQAGSEVKVESERKSLSRKLDWAARLKLRATQSPLY